MSPDPAALCRMKTPRCQMEAEAPLSADNTAAVASGLHLSEDRGARAYHKDISSHLATMAFVRFTKLSPEVREMVWIEAVHNESDGRIFFIHMESSCVMPTRNNISSLLGVNPESRRVALHHNPVKISIYKLPQQTNNYCLSLESR
ncbi:hypothetical protein PG991_000766 [Apiospora marii]|uniref:2EXR domain-containing protein n=1 Tax=Apiospora marii TaxID=335849 RepID=A0ABR1SSW4_9PEZI